MSARASADESRNMGENDSPASDLMQETLETKRQVPFPRVLHMLTAKIRRCLHWG